MPFTGVCSENKRKYDNCIKRIIEGCKGCSFLHRFSDKGLAGEQGEFIVLDDPVGTQLYTETIKKENIEFIKEGVTIKAVRKQ